MNGEIKVDAIMGKDIRSRGNRKRKSLQYFSLGQKSGMRNGAVRCATFREVGLPHGTQAQLRKVNY